MKTKAINQKTRSSLIKAWLPKTGVMNYILSLVLLFFFASGLLSGTFPPSLKTLITFLFSLTTLNFLVLFGNTCFSASSRGLRAAFSLLLVFLCTGAYGYHLNTGMTLDYSVLRDNFAEAFYSESVVLVAYTVGIPVLAGIGIFIIVLLALELKLGLITRQRQELPLLPKALVGGALYALVVISPLPAHDDVTSFFQSIHRYYAEPLEVAEASDQTHSVVTAKSAVSNNARPEELPNVFLVMVESFNANFVEAGSPEGTVYTPYFNSIIKEGLYVERYYGNSIQTAKGHFPIFFSVVPSIQGKVFVHFADRHFYSLPQILKENGYETIFFKANKNLDFDNTRNFLSKNGFSRLETVIPYMKEEDKEYSWGWGLQDDIFYQRFFEYLDGVIEGMEGTKRPVFAALATISNHLSFDMIPREKRLLYSQPETSRQVFANTIHLADMFLESFFNEISKRPGLQNSIIIFTGDHSYPAGEHGMNSCVQGFYDEFFRVPFLLIWKNHVIPARVKDAVYSHMDIAPTLLDLLNLSVARHHFEGVSMFDKDRALHPVYLVQPYSGKYLSVVYYPYKYTKQLSSGKEYLFDLKNDPGEKMNLANKADHATLLEDMREKLQFVFINQNLLKNDEIWPEAMRIPAP